MTGAEKPCGAASGSGIESMGNALKFALLVASFSSGLLFGQAALAVGTLLQ